MNLASLFQVLSGILLAFSTCYADAQALYKTDTSFVFPFNGKNLENWTGDRKYWRVSDGCIVGEVLPGQELTHNSFLVWDGPMPGDFELWLDFRITATGNSGINYRSQLVEGIAFAIKGYQADIDGADQFTGQVYEERGRTTLAYRWERVRIRSLADSSSFQQFIRDNHWLNRDLLGSPGKQRLSTVHAATGQWCRYHIIVKGNHIRHYVNDELVSEVIDEDTLLGTRTGKLGVQVHVGPPMTVWFRHIRIKPL